MVPVAARLPGLGGRLPGHARRGGGVMEMVFAGGADKMGVSEIELVGLRLIYLRHGISRVDRDLGMWCDVVLTSYGGGLGSCLEGSEA